jgi:basic amino acid/polyamine antiporter, APA family
MATSTTTVARPELARDLNVWHAASLVVGIIIGSGIFLVPKRMMEATGSVEMVLGAWIVGGLLSWFGALTFAELGASRPGSGGEYVYIRDGYGPAAGFLYAWNTFLIAKPASIATVAAGVVRIMGEFPAFAFLQREITSSPLVITYGHLLAISMIVLFSILNYLGVRKAGDFHLFFTCLKVAMILAIIFIGFTYSGGGFHNYQTSYPQALGGINGFMAALIAALWAYDGWNNLVMVAGEVREPQRTIPRALIYGITAVAVLYIGTFAAVQYVLPAEQVATADRPASLAIQYVLGPIGAMVISAGIAFSMFVTINGQILAGARIPFAAAQDGYFFPSLARVHPRYRTPGPSIIFQAVLTILLILLVGVFEELFNLALFSEWLFYMLATSTVFVFRRREPHAQLPYRTWGYPVVPVLFILAATVLLAFSFYQGLHPELQKLAFGEWFSSEGMSLFFRSTSVWGAIVILAGLPVHYFFRKRNLETAAA